MSLAEPISSDLFRRVERLRIRCMSRIDQQLAGSYDSTFKGQGIEFEETRPYQAGDDVRAIDWRVTARSGQPYVKLFREERQATVYLMVDGSASLDGPRFRRTPRDVVWETACVLALIAARENDRVGLMLFTDRIEHIVPPGGGTEHAVRIVRDIVCWRPGSRRTDLGPPLQRLSKVERRRCVGVILSDFLCEGYLSPLRVAARRHEIIPAVVSQPIQNSLPRCGMLRTRDPETGRWFWLDTFSRRQRQEYRAAAEAFERRREQQFARLRIPPLRLNTAQDVAVELRRYFERRGQYR